MTQPVVSVVLTSDYASGKTEGWHDLRSALRGLAQQDFHEPTEFLLVETEELAPHIPSDLKDILPSLRIITVPAMAASELKNAGARATAADIVAMIDGDCTPVT